MYRTHVWKFLNQILKNEKITYKSVKSIKWRDIMDFFNGLITAKVGHPSQTNYLFALK